MGEGGVFDIFKLKPKRAKMYFAHFLSKIRFRECSKMIRRGRKPLYQGSKKSGIMASMMPENFQDWQK